MNHPQIENEQIVERYLMGRLRAAEVERFEAHYLACQDCLDQLQLGERFDRALKGVAALDTARVEVASRLGLLARITQLARTPIVLLSLILLAALPSSVLLYERLSGKLEGPTEPQINARILRLSPERSGPNLDGPSARITLTPSPEWIVLALEIDAEGYDAYRAELERDDGEVIWRRDGLDSDTAGAQVILLPPGLLEPGDFRLRLAGIDPALASDAGVTVATFSFRARR